SIATNAVNCILLIFVIIWVYQAGGFAKSATEPHAALMVTAMILFGSIASTAFRFAISCRLKTVKYIHAGIHSLAFILGSYGIWIKFDEKSKVKPNPKPHFGSLHSWYGLTVIIVYLLQARKRLIGGGLVFLLPQTPWPLRIGAKPYHKAVGVGIYNLAGIAALTGILLTITYRFPATILKPVAGYSPASVENVATMIPVLILISCVMTTYLILETRFRRKPPPVFQEPIVFEDVQPGEDNDVTTGEQGESNENKDSGLNVTNDEKV
ncbi:Cytochrome b reductase 1, partial [Orchesella cincta]